MGVLSGTRTTGSKDRRPHTVVEAARLVVDVAVSRVAVFGGVPVGTVRLQRGAVLPEFRGGADRTIDGACPAASLRGPRPPPVAGSGALIFDQYWHWRSRRLRRVGDPPALKRFLLYLTIQWNRDTPFDR